MSAILTILSLVAVLAVDPPEEPEPQPPAPEVVEVQTFPISLPTRRVHLIIGRFDEVSGFVEEEDENLITIRDVYDKANSYSKNRIHRIVRLLDIEKPQPGILFLRDGTILRGNLVKDSFDEVVLEIEGVRSRFPRSTALYAEFDLTVPEKYQRFKAAIKPEQYLRRFELSRWLFNEHRYDLAKTELEQLVSDSQLPQAIQLLKIVTAQILLDNGTITSKEDRTIPGATPSGDGQGLVDLRDLLPKQLLSAEDVNIIRVYEIDFDRPPKMNITPESIREILEKYGDSNLIPADSVGRTKLFRAEPIHVVKLLFDLKARDLYSRIDVLNEPKALNLFRQRVHDAWLIPNCATSRCHGGLDGGRLFLHRRNHKNEQVRYTNLLILERWNATQRPLIDYATPANSLLVQYALPRKEARFPHPDVKGFRSVFSRSNQRLLKETLEWITNMYQPRPRYPVSYEPPILDSPDLPIQESVPTDGETPSRQSR